MNPPDKIEPIHLERVSNLDAQPQSYEQGHNNNVEYGHEECVPFVRHEILHLDICDELPSPEGHKESISQINLFPKHTVYSLLDSYKLYIGR